MTREPFQCPACKHVHCLTGECQCDCDPVYEMHCRIAAAVEECERIEQLPYAALSGMAALPLREAARMIRAKLENG